LRHTNLKQKKKSKTDAALMIKRIFLLVLAALMILGSIYYVVFFTFINASAADVENKEYLYDENQKLRVGLQYDSKVFSSFNMKAENGFNYGYVSHSEFHSLISDSTASVTATVDGNLKLSSGSYYAAEAGDTVVIGGYHIQLGVDGLGNFESLLQSCRDVLKVYGIHAFPAFVNGKTVIRIGDCKSEDEANELLQTVTGALALSNFTGEVLVAEPSSTAVTIANPANNKIVFEYDNSIGTSDEFGVTAIQSADETAYIVTPANNSYSGVFIFARYNSLVSLINLVTLEEYVEGVLPYEIGVTWSDEAQKAFSIAVRSYSISKRGRHSSLGFDICNSICCQVYRGCGRTDENVRANVKATEGMVMVSGGKVASTFYSSSTGGCTVSNADAWGSSESAYPYLKAKATPWERYEEHKDGSWTVSFSPSELAASLRSKGYTDITGNIKSVVINSLGKNSSYVSSITFTDVNGNSVTIKRSDNVRLALSLKSANFVVGKAGETVSVTDLTLDGYDKLISEYTSAAPAAEDDEIRSFSINFDDLFAGGSTDENGNTDDSAEEQDTVTVLTKDGLVTVDKSTVTSVITENGTVSYDQSLNVITGSNAALRPDASFGEKLLKLETVSTTREITLEGDDGDFIFVGRGYGHGVGLSQWGLHDLAEIGADYKTIAKAYYSGAEIVHYRTITK